MQFIDIKKRGMDSRWAAFSENFFPGKFKKLDAYVQQALFELKNDGAITHNTEGLIAGKWGNTGYSATSLLTELSFLKMKGLGENETVVECGSGYSTLMLGIYAQHFSQRVISLEHEAKWQKRTSRALAVIGGTINTVSLPHVPLVNLGNYDWYDINNVKLPEKIKLVVCDGPPGHTKGGRYGLIPQLHMRLSQGAIILLDDADREGERKIIREWEENFGLSLIEIKKDKTHSVAIIEKK